MWLVVLSGKCARKCASKSEVALVPGSKVSAARLSKLAGSSVCVVFDFDPRSKIDGLFKEWNPLPSTEVVTTENKDWAYGVSKDTELVWLFCLGLHDIQTSYQRTSTSGAAVPPRSLDCNRPSTP
jgi:hypothetical protein